MQNILTQAIENRFGFELDKKPKDKSLIDVYNAWLKEQLPPFNPKLITVIYCKKSFKGYIFLDNEIERIDYSIKPKGFNSRSNESRFTKHFTIKGKNHWVKLNKNEIFVANHENISYLDINLIYADDLEQMRLYKKVFFKKEKTILN